MVRLDIVAACGIACLAGHAAAHAIIVDSSPAPLAHVAAGTLHVTLRYNSRIDAGRSKLTISHGDEPRRVPTTSVDAPDTLAATVELTPGAYEIAWQVLATDGHVTRGRIPFTVDPVKATAQK